MCIRDRGYALDTLAMDVAINGNNPDGSESAPVIGVYETTNGITLEVYTNEPGIQVYTGNFLDGTVKGKKGITYPQRASVCLGLTNQETLLLRIAQELGLDKPKQ